MCVSQRERETSVDIRPLSLPCERKKNPSHALSNNVCYCALRAEEKAQRINTESEKTCSGSAECDPVHCSVIWPSAWMEDLNIMTLDMTERTCWLHSSGSAPRQGGLCLGDTSVLKLPVFVSPKVVFSKLSPTVNSYVIDR